jgi:hypothetical protein
MSRSTKGLCHGLWGAVSISRIRIPFHALPERLAVDGVAIAEEIGRRGLFREGVDDLLSGPGGGGMLGPVEVKDAPAMVGEDDEDEEDAQVRGGNGEEVDRDEVPDMVGEERSPGLRGGCAPLRHQPGDGALPHLEAELEQFAMESGSAPQGIGRGHSPDQGADFGVDRRATPGGRAGEPGPVLAEATPLPPQNGVGSHDQEGLPPPGPEPGQPDPEQAVGGTKLGPGRRSPVHGKLVAQCQVLEGELAVAADEEGEEPKQVE